jgi:type VI protein secretion system component VasF
VLSRQGFPVATLFAQVRGPALAAAAIAAAVLPLREAFSATDVNLVVCLATEIVAGAVAYVVVAWLFARVTLQRFIQAAREQLRRRARGAPAPG